MKLKLARCINEPDDNSIIKFGNLYIIKDNNYNLIGFPTYLIYGDRDKHWLQDRFEIILDKPILKLLNNL